MAAVAIKSFAYLGLFGTVGYVLMKVVEPSEEKKRKISAYNDPSGVEERSQKALFLKRIQEATTDTPIYLKKSPRAAAAAEAQQETPSQPSKREIN